jgi:hypothetical protein
VTTQQWEQGLGELTGVAGFDSHGRMVGRGGRRDRHKPTVWALQIRVYQPHAEPIEIQRQWSGPEGLTPETGLQTFMKRPVGEDHWIFDLERIHDANSQAASSSPDTAAALAAAGGHAGQLVFLLPGVPRVAIPAWTPESSGAATGTPTPQLLRCPNCGGPLELTAEGRCTYCETRVQVGQ